MTNFVHLHVRSEFSLKDSIVRIGGLVGATAKAGMPSVALTDLMNFYGLVKVGINGLATNAPARPARMASRPSIWPARRLRR